MLKAHVVIHQDAFGSVAYWGALKDGDRILWHCRHGYAHQGHVAHGVAQRCANAQLRRELRKQKGGARMALIECPICRKAFANKSALGGHLHTHSVTERRKHGIRPKKAKEAHVHATVQVGAGGKTYTCPDCGFRTVSGYSYGAHRRNSHRRTPARATPAKAITTLNGRNTRTVPEPREGNVILRPGVLVTVRNGDGQDTTFFGVPVSLTVSVPE